MYRKAHLLSTTISVRVYAREATNSDEVSAEDIAFLKELMGDVSLPTITKRALKKYIDELPDMLLEQQKQTVEQQLAELERIRSITGRK